VDEGISEKSFTRNPEWDKNHHTIGGFYRHLGLFKDINGQF
jgi:hypothetical protein